MDNFDLRKFLAESKLTKNSKLQTEFKALPALDKPLKDIGMEMNEKLKGMGYQTKLVGNMGQEDDALEKNGDKKMATLYYEKFQSGNSQLEIRVHKNNADDLKKIVDSYNFPEEHGGYEGGFVNGDLVRATIHAGKEEVQEKVGTPQYGSTGPSADDIFDPRAQDPTYEGAKEAMEEIVAEYVTEALKGKDIKEVTGIIERTCNKAAMEMKIEVIHEVLEAYDGRINELEENAVFKEMLDETKMANVKEIRKGLYEMADSIKEEYTKAYSVEEKKAPKKEKEEEEK